MNQSRRDALADAATAAQILGVPEWSEMDGRMTVRGRLAVAASYGLEAVRWTQSPRSDAHHEAAYYARHAARQAFDAVPALKESK